MGTKVDTATSSVDPLLTTGEAAKRMGVSVKCMQNWIDGGILHAGLTPGGHRRIRTSALAELIKRTGIAPQRAGREEADSAARILAHALREVVVGALSETPEIVAARHALEATEAVWGAK